MKRPENPKRPLRPRTKSKPSRLIEPVGRLPEDSVILKKKRPPGSPFPGGQGRHTHIHTHGTGRQLAVTPLHEATVSRRFHRSKTFKFYKRSKNLKKFSNFSSRNLALGNRPSFPDAPAMSHSHIDVRYVANLARLELSDEEVADSSRNWRPSCNTSRRSRGSTSPASNPPPTPRRFSTGCATTSPTKACRPPPSCKTRPIKPKARSACPRSSPTPDALFRSQIFSISAFTSHDPRLASASNSSPVKPRLPPFSSISPEKSPPAIPKPAPISPTISKPRSPRPPTPTSRCRSAASRSPSRTT